ncbi:hypothetical protein F5148DRAFT_1151497 [Russula earlei]|uniref:Uncharacterized protein n=1 Tax=Russula earlei TaxID=71964 RepID=A0ACC0U016_9AGAM|nr:hypothetical protein F5148DRAFT_1151497 [Russula earlei]
MTRPLSIVAHLHTLVEKTTKTPPGVTCIRRKGWDLRDIAWVESSCVISLQESDGVSAGHGRAVPRRVLFDEDITARRIRRQASSTGLEDANHTRRMCCCGVRGRATWFSSFVALKYGILPNAQVALQLRLAVKFGGGQTVGKSARQTVNAIFNLLRSGRNAIRARKQVGTCQTAAPSTPHHTDKAQLDEYSFLKLIPDTPRKLSRACLPPEREKPSMFPSLGNGVRKLEHGVGQEVRPIAHLVLEDNTATRFPSLGSVIGDRRQDDENAEMPFRSLALALTHRRVHRVIVRVHWHVVDPPDTLYRKKRGISLERGIVVTERPFNDMRDDRAYVDPEQRDYSLGHDVEPDCRDEREGIGVTEPGNPGLDRQFTSQAY